MRFIESAIRHFRGPRCPVAEDERQWIDLHFDWLAAQFGQEVLLRDPLTPASDCLPQRWTGDHSECETLVETLCEFMRVDPRTVEVRFHDDSDPIRGLSRVGDVSHAGAAGLYMAGEARDRFVLSIDEQGLDDPAGLVATICHELGHVLLLGHGRIATDRNDHEPLTDLLTVYFGAGVFTANTSFRFDQWQDNTHQGWSVRRQGYLSEEAFGYALGRYTSLRGEERPDWWRCLSKNVRHFVEETDYYFRMQPPPYDHGTP